MSVPANSTPPTISGDVRSHEALTSISGTWSSGLVDERHWELADDGAGTGATESETTTETFWPDNSMVGKYIRYGETFRNAEGPAVAVSYSDWYGPIAVANHTDCKHFICGTVAEIEAARDLINAEGTGGALGILPGSYNMKSSYRKELEIDPDTATIPTGDTAPLTYAMYFSSPDVTVYAVVPGTVRLYGEADAIVNENTTGPFSAFRGGMFYFSDDAENGTVFGIDIDGSVPVSETFNINNYCDKTDLGVDCWDLGHKAIFAAGDNVRVLDCKVHNWAGEMIYGGSDGSAKRLEIGYCEFYDNQVSSLSGNWQIHCHHNEFHDLTGQCMEGLHAFTSRYHDNYFHDISGGGINILGPVTAITPAEGWNVDISGNVFENFTSISFGAVYLSKQTTPDVSAPSNVRIRNNVFRDVRVCLSISLGIAWDNTFENNLCIIDKTTTMQVLASPSGHFQNCLIKSNQFWVTQYAKDNNADLNVASIPTGTHTGTKFVDNSYHEANPPIDNNSGDDLYFRGESYYQIAETNTNYLTTTGSPDDQLIPENIYGSTLTTGVLWVQFSTAPMYLRMATGYPHGAELKLIGRVGNTTLAKMAYLIDGRGCQLKGGFPAFLWENDYVLLRYDSVLSLWVEMERNTPGANAVLKLSNKGLAADIPLLSSVPALTVSTVNVIDEALFGWKYFETDTNTLKIYTDSGWQTVWAA